MSAPPDINDRLEAAAEKAEGASEILHQVANGPVGAHVASESGPIPTVLEWQKQNLDALGDVADLQQFDTDLQTGGNAAKGPGLLPYSQALPYPAGSLGAGVKAAADAAASAIAAGANAVGAPRSMYRRSKVLEVSFRDATYDTLLSTHSYDYLYPQAIAIDSVTNELFVLRGANSGANAWAWIWVYDLTTGLRKTTFTTGQQWRESIIIRYNAAGTVRYLYTIGDSNNVIRVDITTLPTNLSTVTIANTYTAPVAQSLMAYDGQHFYIQSYQTYLGNTRRNRFDVYNATVTAKQSDLVIPQEVIGTLVASYSNAFPKAQGVCIHNGALYIGIGSPYNPVTDAAAIASPINRQGIARCGLNGSLQAQALVYPDRLLADLATLAGYTPSLVENEGICSAGGKLYAAWVTLNPTDRVAAGNAGKGIFITLEESSLLTGVVDSSAGAAMQTGVSVQRFQQDAHHSTGQLIDPWLGTTLTTLAGIAAMMNGVGLERYNFGGTNQTITDLSAAAVATTGRLIECKNVNGLTHIFNISGASVEQAMYTLTGTYTAQYGPLYGDAEYGSDGNGEYILHANGVKECWFNFVLTSLAIATSDPILGFKTAANQTWTFPGAAKPFVAAPTVSGQPGNNVQTVNVPTLSITTTTAQFTPTSAASSAAANRLGSLRAIGRYK